jgi:hypothetical protein
MISMVLEDIRQAVAAALTPDHFYLDPSLELRVEHRDRDCIPWEIYRGHLLDRSQTWQECSFESWLIFLRKDAAEPTLAVRLEGEARRIFVTRSILIYGHEAYDEAGVIQTREVQKWHRELVGTIDLERVPSVSHLQKHLEHYLFLAVIGTSRLPITSLESPLPGFTFGHLGYFPGALATSGQVPLRDPSELLQQVFFQGPDCLRETKLLELALRALPSGDLIEAFRRRLASKEKQAGAILAFPILIRSLFNNVALSPWTDFAPNLMLLLGQPWSLDPSGWGMDLELLSYLLRHQVRHLTAYDLHVFHNRGANYPDALALDLWLWAYVQFVEKLLDKVEDQPAVDGPLQAPKKRRLRRALRQAWLVRQQLEGVLVPDHPTSPGENLRVLPGDLTRLPDEQVLQPDQRRKRLFQNDPAKNLLQPTARRLLEQSLRDLEHDAELRELGMATFLDRPFGVFKQPGEVDRTPLFAYEAFSRTIAMSRLNAWKELGFLTKDAHATLAERLLNRLSVKGIQAMDLPGHQRPGVVALEDARRASPDFVILRATRSTECTFAQLCLGDPRVQTLPVRRTEGRLFPIRSPRARVLANAEAFITIYNEQMEPVIEFGLGQRDRGPVRYREWMGVETLADGLRVLRFWDDEEKEVSSSPEARG